MKPELYSISVVLQSLSDAIISPAQGYQAYGFFLSVINTSSSRISGELHDTAGPKPFTVSPLQGKFYREKGGLRIKTGNQYNLRLTFLKSDVMAHFLDGALKWGSRPVQIGPAVFQVIKVDTLPAVSPSACFTSFQQLYDEAVSEIQLKLEFRTPTAFRSGGRRNVIFPELPTIFAGYIIKWQAFSNVKMNADINKWLLKALITRYKLETRMLNFNGYKEVGVIGRVYLELDKKTTDEAIHAINVLADFAYYCGTGAKTTMGMGQTERIK